MVLFPHSEPRSPSLRSGGNNYTQVPGRSLGVKGVTDAGGRGHTWRSVCNAGSALSTVADLLGTLSSTGPGARPPEVACWLCHVPGGSAWERD